jgi:hypothetical protein
VGANGYHLPRQQALPRRDVTAQDCRDRDGGLASDNVVTTQIDAENVVARGFEQLLDPAGKHMKILVRV